MPETIALYPEDIDLLLELARGLTSRQIAMKWHISPSMVGGMLHQLYGKLGVHDLGFQSRAYALAVAITRHSLEPPEELQAAIEALLSGRVQFDDDLGLTVLTMIVEGNSPAEIADALELDVELIRNRVADMQLDVGIATFPVFCLAVVALWAGKLAELELNLVHEFNDDDGMLVLDVILERSVEATAARLGSTPAAAKGRLGALKFRLGVRTIVEVVELAIREQWVKIPQVPKLLAAIELVRSEGLSARELRAVSLLALGVNRSEISQRMADDLHDVSLDWILHRLYAHIGVSSAPALVAIVRWAGNPLAPESEPAPDGPLFSSRELELLGCLAGGMSTQDMTTRFQAGKGTISNELGTIYRKLGAVNAQHAVGLAAREGLLADFFASIGQNCVPEGVFSSLYIRYLEQVACGRHMFDILMALGVESQTRLKQRIRADQERLDVPLNTQIAILAYRKTIEVSGPPVVPALPAETPPGPQPPRPPQPAEVPATAAQLPVEQSPAQAEPPVSEPSQEDQVLAAVRRLCISNNNDGEVRSGKYALSKKLAQLVSDNLALVAQAIRDGRLARPQWAVRFADHPLGTEVGLFLMDVLEGQTLNEIRAKSATADEQAFRKWHAKQVCAPLGARGPKDAAVIALWAGLVE